MISRYIQVHHRKEILEECSLSLLGRFLSDKPVNFRAAKNLLRTVWRMGNDLKIVEVGEELFQFKFSLESQLKWVIENGPWCFDNHLLVLRRWEKGMTAMNVSFSRIQLWVQVWGLPFDLMNAEVGKVLGEGLGDVLDVDVKAFTSDQSHFLRVRVDLPLDKPLRRGAPVVSPEGDRTWVGFKYERIVGLCYSCGRLGHEMKACTHKRPSDNTTANTETPYGEWLKAGVQRSMEEPSQGGGGTQSRDSPQEENPSKPTTTTVTNLATPAENAVPKLNYDKNGKDGVKRATNT